MKFMIEYSIRSAGLNAEQSLANIQALLTAFSKWKPEEGLKVHAFLGKVAGLGGYALVEADDANVVQSFLAKFNAWNDMQVIPVTDVSDSVKVSHAALQWTQNAMKG